MADQIKGITIEFKGNTIDLENSISLLNKTMTALKNESKLLNKQLKLDPSNAEKLNNVLKNLQNQQKVLTQELKIYNTELKELEVGSKEWLDQSKKIDQVQNALDRVNAQLDQLNGWSSAQLNKQFESLGKSLQNVGGKIKSVGDALTPLSTAATAALGAVAYEAVNFESAFTGVAKTVDATDAELATLREGLLDLATTTPATAEEIAGIAESAGQLGIAKDDILAFSETMAGLSSATNLTAEDAATMIAQFANVVDIQGEFEQFGSALVELGNNGASTEAEIMELAQRLSGAGSVAGMSAQEILGLSASMANVGISAEAGGTAMSTLISQMEKASVQGGASLQALADVANMTAEEFAESWQNEPSVAIDAFLKGLNDIQASGGDVYGTLEDLGITEKRLTDTVLRLASANGEVAKNTEMANEAWEKNSALQTEVDKRSQTTAVMLQNLKDSFTKLADSLGQIILPIINNVVTGLQGIVNWLTQLSPNMQLVVVAITGLIAIAAPLITLIGNLITSIGTITAALGSAGLAGSFVAVAAPISAAIALFAALYSSSEQFRTALGNLIQTIIETVTPILQALWNTLMQIWGAIQTYLIPVIQQVADFIATYVMPIIQAVWEFIQNYIVPILTNLADLMGGAVSTAIALVCDGISILINVLTVVFGWFTDLWNFLDDLGVWDAFVAILEVVKDVVNAVIDAVQWLVDKVEAAADAVAGFVSDVSNALGSIGGAIGDFVSWVNPFDSGGFGDLAYSSGGYASGGINLSTNITVNTTQPITRSQVASWADIINEELGRRL